MGKSFKTEKIDIFLNEYRVYFFFIIFVYKDVESFSGFALYELFSLTLVVYNDNGITNLKKCETVSLLEK